MPTGYTADIEKGISFEKFVWNCARAFGDLVMLRDDSTAPIPKKFEHDNFYSDLLTKAKLELHRLCKLTDAEVRAEADKENAAEIERIRKRIEDKALLEQKYKAMLEKVKAWTPPSPDHIHLKEFMISQIKESIQFDCDVSGYSLNMERVTPDLWHATRLEQARRDVMRYTDEVAKEEKRAADRTRWVQQLRYSVGEPPA